jgi:hypothetical protein
MRKPSADTGTSTGRLMLLYSAAWPVLSAILSPPSQKEATRRRAQGATLQELADSYDRNISTMGRVTCAG